MTTPREFSLIDLAETIDMIAADMPPQLRTPDQLRAFTVLLRRGQYNAADCHRAARFIVAGITMLTVAGPVG